MKSAAIILLGLLGAACSAQMAAAPSDGRSYTLYRSSAVLPGMSFDDADKANAMRIHVATFDALEGEAYNQENCRLAEDLFNSQPGISTRFWCEKGRYRP
jgi:hypothetical protein